jgi:hypothetical protein
MLVFYIDGGFQRKKWPTANKSQHQRNPWKHWANQPLSTIAKSGSRLGSQLALRRQAITK